MDALDRFVDFAGSLTFAALPPATVERAKERIVDTLACALAAYGCETAQSALAIAPVSSSPILAGRILGSEQTVAGDTAAFVNTCMIRYLDFNDTFVGLHPSDALGAILAVAPQVDATGRDVIVAAVIAYEVSCRIEQSGQLNERGWDQGFAIGVGTAVALGGLMGLTPELTRHAAAITAVTSMHMRATRSGQLSMWKGAATAHAVRDAVFAAQLARTGMTGPESPFSGRDGLEELVTGHLDLMPFGEDERDFLITATKTKYWPVVYNMQALVWAAIDLREQVPPEDLAVIKVETYHGAWRESGSEPAKWRPRTRETADHSLPYILAWTLRHGHIDAAAFKLEAYLDDTFYPLMDKVTVSADPGIKGYPDDITMRLTATHNKGHVYRAISTNPLGHERNPLSREQLNDKFRRACTARMSAHGIDAALDTWWALENHSARRATDILVEDQIPR